MLPEADGFEICKQARERKNIPIIMEGGDFDENDKKLVGITFCLSGSYYPLCGALFHV